MPFPESSAALARFILRGKVLGLLLTSLPSFLVLHGNTVIIREKAIGFCGAIGQGKSTMTSCFLNENFPLLSDDLMAIRCEEGLLKVQPGLPEVRLWPNSKRLLDRLGIHGSLLYPETKKKRFVLDSKNPNRFRQKPSPLQTLYFLSRRAKGKIRIEVLEGQAAFKEILSHAYLPLIQDPKVLRRQFEAVGQLIQKVSIKRLEYPSGFHHLDEIREALLSDVKKA